MSKPPAINRSPKTPENEALFNAMAYGLQIVEGGIAALGLPHWNVALVAYNPANPAGEYLVIGTPGEEALQDRIDAVMKDSKPTTTIDA